METLLISRYQIFIISIFFDLLTTGTFYKLVHTDLYCILKDHQKKRTHKVTKTHRKTRSVFCNFIRNYREGDKEHKRLRHAKALDKKKHKIHQVKIYYFCV